MQCSLGLRNIFLSNFSKKLRLFGEVMLRALLRDYEKMFMDFDWFGFQVIQADVTKCPVTMIMLDSIWSQWFGFFIQWYHICAWLFYINVSSICRSTFWLSHIHANLIRVWNASLSIYDPKLILFYLFLFVRDSLITVVTYFDKILALHMFNPWLISNLYRLPLFGYDSIYLCSTLDYRKSYRFTGSCNFLKHSTRIYFYFHSVEANRSMKK